jgi:hypothetical protein
MQDVGIDCGSARPVLASGLKLEANVGARLYRRPV